MSGGGKGFGKKGQEVYEYYANFAVGLCEGPVFAVLRVWADSNLIYDKYNRDEDDIVEIGFSEGETETKGSNKAGKGKGSASNYFNFRFYPGTEDQQPDPFMVQANGSRPTPAHRGLSYLFFERFPLKDFGNRIPTITAEVVVSDQAQQRTKITIFDTIDASLGINNTYSDPLRGRFYTIDAGIIRVFDVASRAEIKRVELTSIEGSNLYREFNWPYPEDSDINLGSRNVAGRFLGPTASGDLLAVTDEAASLVSNTQELAFIDPNTFAIKSVFGIINNLQLTHTERNVSLPTSSCVVGWGDDVSGGSRYFTAVSGFRGGLYFFNHLNEPVSYDPANYGLYGLVFNSSPGYTRGDMVVVYQMLRVALDEERIVRREYPLGEMPFFGPGVPDTNLGTTPKRVAASKITTIFSVGGSIQDRCSMPINAIGEDWVGMFVSIPSGNDQGTWAYKINTDDGSVIWRQRLVEDQFPTDATLNNIPQTLIGGEASIRVGDFIYNVNFEEQDYDDIVALPEDAPAASEVQFNMPLGGSANLVQAINDPDLGWTYGYFNPDSYVQTPISVERIIREVAGDVGIRDDQVDTTQLKADSVIGIQMENPSPARSVIENLSKLFFFDLVESDYSLKAVTRELQTSVVTIPQRDLGIVDGITEADGAQDVYAETRIQEIDLPRTVIVSYKDTKKDYETGTQHFRRPRSPMETMQSRDVLDISLPIALDPTTAKQAAQKILYSTWTERVSYQLALPWKYLKYDPTDVVTILMDDGLTLPMRLSEMDFGTNLGIEAGGISVSPGTYASDAEADDLGGKIPVDTTPVPVSDVMVFDTPYLTDSDSLENRAFAYYWGLRSYGPGFRFGSMERRTSPYPWESEDVLVADIPWGSVSGKLGPNPWGQFSTDYTTVIRFEPAFDFSLEPDLWEWASIDDNDWPDQASRNTIIVNDEIIYFKNVTANADGSYSLDTLIRGARGTENAAYLHKANEIAALVSVGVDQANEDFMLVGRDFQFRPLTPRSSSALPELVKELTGASHKPWGPWDFDRANSGSDIDIDFSRRSRLSGQLRDGTGTVPNVENIEEYEVYLLADAFDHSSFDPDDSSTYVRSWTGLATPSITYTAAEISADGNTQNSTLHFVAFQRNAFVGRGFPGWATTYPPL